MTSSSVPPGGNDGGAEAGEAYVVFGSRAGFGVPVGGRQVLDLTTLTAAQGFIIQGDSAIDGLGLSVSAAGDVNGDGIGDLIVGAPDGGSMQISAGKPTLYSAAEVGSAWMSPADRFSMSALLQPPRDS